MKTAMTCSETLSLDKSENVFLNPLISPIWPDYSQRMPWTYPLTVIDPQTLQSQELFQTLSSSESEEEEEVDFETEFAEIPTPTQPHRHQYHPLYQKSLTREYFRPLWQQLEPDAFDPLYDPFLDN
ncbi:hypothetical protein [Circovirus-like genome DCCV-4]|uniref:hypothetical protein n=1 Tax=Circovirus-like genome DCCV-4 TaxID=1788444 RepID=UPI0007F9E07B|nr:hypothetical protein [Circovirus-like genome DCCV-4]AMB42960.1 hypothetical protein [Circovirus-like genome DCCV-4]